VSAKVLQVANSAYFNRAREAKTPSQAVGFLGFDLVKALVLTCGAAGALGHIDGSGLSAEKVIEHSIGVGTLAAALLRQAGGSAVDVEDASAAGLLHDIGMLLLAENEPQAYGRVTAEKRRTGLPLEDLERAVFGVTHADAGAFLLGTWGLGDGIVEAVSRHHDRVDELSGIASPADAVALASILMAERDGPPFALPPGQAVQFALPEGVGEDRVQAWRRLRDGIAKVEVRA
jgi:putative nucleotidyltransferase with HDIG domain